MDFNYPANEDYNNAMMGTQAIPTQGDESASTTVDNTVSVVITLIICAIGLIGNLIVIFVIVTLKECQKSFAHHWYVLQLAISDSLFLLTLPFLAVEQLKGIWIYPEGLCKAVLTIRFLNYYSSVFFLTILSIDRYIAICHPFSAYLSKFHNKRATAVTTTVIWIVIILICIPVMLYSAKTGTRPQCNCRLKFPQPSPEVRCRSEGEAQFEECVEYLTSINQDLPSHEPFCVSPLEEGSITIDRNTTGTNNVHGDNNTEYGNYDYFSGGIETANSNNNDTTVSVGIGSMYQHGGVNFSFSGTNLALVNGLEPYCGYGDKPHGWFAFIWFNFIAMFILPFIVICICYGLIITKVTSTKVRLQAAINSTHSSSPGRSKRNKQVSKSDRDKVRVTVMCAILVASFLLCWILFHAAHIAKIVGISSVTSKFCQDLTTASFLLAYLSSALNPYIYNFMSTNFSTRCREAFDSCMKRSMFGRSCLRNCCWTDATTGRGSIDHSTSHPTALTTRNAKKYIHNLLFLNILSSICNYMLNL